MSYDLGVWYPQNRLRKEEATKLYVRLCDGDTSGVIANPAIDAFYAELTAKHPEIDTIPEEKMGDYDYCPWSCKLDYSRGHLIMNCVWSKATYVHQLVQDLARKHGLALYDPQSEQVTYPDGSPGVKNFASRTSLLILGVSGLAFAAMFAYSGRLYGRGRQRLCTPLLPYASCWPSFVLGERGDKCSVDFRCIHRCVGSLKERRYSKVSRAGAARWLWLVVWILPSVASGLVSMTTSARGVALAVI